MTEAVTVTLSAVYDLSTGRRISERIGKTDTETLARLMAREYLIFKEKTEGKNDEKSEN